MDLLRAKCKTYIVLDGVRVPNSKPTNFMTKPQHLTFNSDQHQIILYIIAENNDRQKNVFFVFSHGLTCFRQQQTIIPKMQNIKFEFLWDLYSYFVSIDLKCVSYLLGKKTLPGPENKLTRHN